jgi:hypothetical protein
MKFGLLRGLGRLCGVQPRVPFKTRCYRVLRRHDQRRWWGLEQLAMVELYNGRAAVEWCERRYADGVGCGQRRKY